jgi:N12 class adenine-specific DNA methylase
MANIFDRFDRAPGEEDLPAPSRDRRTSAEAGLKGKAELGLMEQYDAGDEFETSRNSPELTAEIAAARRKGDTRALAALEEQRTGDNPFPRPLANRSPGGNVFDQFDRAPAKPKDSILTPGKSNDYFDALGKGISDLGTSLKSAKWVMTGGDTADMAKSLAAQIADSHASAGEQEIQAGAKAVNDASGTWDTAKAIGGLLWSMATNPYDTGKMVVQNLPNAVPSMIMGAAGAAAGSAMVPGAGGLVGGMAGLGAGSATVEFGAKLSDKVQEALQARKLAPTAENIAGILDEPGFRDSAMQEGAAKGITIGTIDMLSAAVGGRIATAPFRAATKKVLTSAGVDVADTAAVNAALKTAPVQAAIKAEIAAIPTSRKVGMGAAGIGVDSAMEGVGEYAGEAMATGQGKLGDAILEAFTSLGQSTAEVGGSYALQRGSSMINPREAAIADIAKAATPDQAIEAFTRATAPTPAAPEPPLEFDRLGALGMIHAQPTQPEIAGPQHPLGDPNAIPYDYSTPAQRFPQLPAPEDNTGSGVLINDGDAELTRPERFGDREARINTVQQAREEDAYGTGVRDIVQTPEGPRRRPRVTLDEAGNIIDAPDEHRPFLSLVRREARPHAAAAIEAHAINPDLTEAALAAPDMGPRAERTVFEAIIHGRTDTRETRALLERHGIPGRLADANGQSAQPGAAAAPGQQPDAAGSEQTGASTGTTSPDRQPGVIRPPGEIPVDNLQNTTPAKAAARPLTEHTDAELRLQAKNTRDPGQLKAISDELARRKREATPKAAPVVPVAGQAGGLKAKSKHSNMVIRQVRDRNGNMLGTVMEPYDGSIEGARKAAEAATKRMYYEYPDAGNVASRMGATDENGNPKWAISPNFAHINPVDSVDGRATFGDDEAIQQLFGPKVAKDVTPTDDKTAAEKARTERKESAKSKTRAKLDAQKKQPAEPTEIGGFAKGDMVRFTVPGSRGPQELVGRVDRLMPTGAIEVRSQQGGIYALLPGDLKKVEAETAKTDADFFKKDDRIQTAGGRRGTVVAVNVASNTVGVRFDGQSGMNMVNLKATEVFPVKVDAPAATEAAPLKQPSGRKEVGKNSEGATLYEDARGVRTLVEPGQTVGAQETVQLVPTRQGVKISRGERENRFKTVEELEAEKPAKPAKERWESYVIRPTMRNGEMFVSEPRGDGTYQNLASFKVRENGTRGPIGHFYESPSTRGPVEKAVARWDAEQEGQQDELPPEMRAYEAKAEAAEKAPVKAAEQAPGYGATNTVFTADAAEKARAILRKKLGQINVGIDPEVIQAGIQLAGYHVEAGARKFGQFTKAMIDDLGEAVRPYLKSWYLAVRNYPGFDASNMNSEAEIETWSQVENQPAPVAKPAPQADNQATKAVEVQDDTPTSGSTNALNPPVDAGPAGNEGPVSVRGATSGEREGRADDADVRGPGGDTESRPDAAQGVGDGTGNAGVSDRAPDALAGSGKRVSARDFRPGPGDLDRKGSWFDTAERNIDIIELALAIEAEKRQATPQEQAKLARYVGFGASEIRNALFPVPQAYQKREDPTRLIWPDLVRDDKWKPLARRVEALPVEWQKSILQSTQYAHYTSAPVVNSIWGALERIGFTGGRVLEPGMGIGTFNMLMPEGMHKTSKYTGIEFDAPTALIAKLLSPSQNMLHDDFIKRMLPKDFFDLAIGNPPFSKTKIVADPEYAKYGFSLHDYFFAKSLDRVRPGGLLVFVTSHFTMDKQAEKARKYMADRADLLGAIRLPSTAFGANAGTSVVTDVIFLRKRMPGEQPAGAAWNEVGTIETKDGTAVVNRYFVEHPEMVLGQQRLSGNRDDQDRYISGLRGVNEYTVVSYDASTEEIEGKFAAAVNNLPQNVYSVLNRPAKDIKAETAKIDFDPTIRREGVIYKAKDGTLMRVAQGVGVPIAAELKLTPKDEAWFDGYLGLRDLVNAARAAQFADGDWQKALKTLNKAYDKFRKEHGPINDFRTMVRKSTDEDGATVESESRIFKNKRLYREDYDSSIVTQLETINEEGQIIKAPFLEGRTVGKPVSREIKTIGDALAVSLDERGALDLDDIAQRLAISRAEAIESLGNQIYETPQGEWQLADEYLSGNVVAKLGEAEVAARVNPALERNLKALYAVQPEPLGPSNISVKLGAPWVPESVISAFAEEIEAGSVTFDPKTESWQVAGAGGKGSQQRRRAGLDYGTAKRSPSELLESALNSAVVKITTTVDKKTVIDQEATDAANAVIKKMKDHFRAWVWQDSDRAADVVQTYNQRYNNIAGRKFDGSHLTLPGVSLRFSLHAHQLRAIWRIIQTGNTYLAHAVGAGKTIEMIAAGMEQKRLGLIRKPMYVVPNHMLEQFSNEFMELYPLANIMVADDESFSPERRKNFIAAATLNAPDAIVISHDGFSRIGVKEESVAPIRDALLLELQTELNDVRADQRVRRSQLEQQIEQIRQRFDRIISAGGKDAIKFEDIGADFLFVDEAHMFRKLDFATNQQIKGIDPSGSKRAMGMYVKTRWLDTKRPGRSLAFASGTPVTNTMGELYTLMRYFDHGDMEKDGISTFDSWSRGFGEVVAALEPNAVGKYEVVERFAKFDNIPELMSRVRQFMDVLNSDQLGSVVKRPDIKGGKPALHMTQPGTALADYMANVLEPRIIASKAWKPSKDEPFNPDPIIAIISDARFAALDPRFFGATVNDENPSRLNDMADRIIADHKELSDRVYLDRDNKPEALKGGTQIVFYNLGFGEQSQKNRGFNARAALTKRLTDGGIPRGEIAWFDDANTDIKKEAVFKDMRAGKIRVLIGSAKKMGTGVNVQKRLAALHYFDPPWYPADLTQPHGRLIRQGNQNLEGAINWYSTEGTYDSQMWQIVGRKQRFIDQAFTGDKNLRSMEDLSEASLFEQAAAVASGDPRALQLAGLKQDVERLERLQAAHANEQMAVRRAIENNEGTVRYRTEEITKLAAAADVLGGHVLFHVGKVQGVAYQKAGEFGAALKAAFNKAIPEVTAKADGKITHPLGSIEKGIAVRMVGYVNEKKESDGSSGLYMQVGPITRNIVSADEKGLGDDVDDAGLVRKITNAANEIHHDLDEKKRIVAEAQTELVRLRKKKGAPFDQLQELLAKGAELKALEAELAPAVPGSNRAPPPPVNDFSHLDALYGPNHGIDDLMGPMASRPGYSAPYKDMAAYRFTAAKDAKGMPVYMSRNITLADGRVKDEFAVAPGRKAMAFNIYDNKMRDAEGEPTKVGEVLVHLDRDGKFASFRNIEIQKKYRNSGYYHGEGVVAGMLQHNGATPMEVFNIQSKARGDEDDALPYWKHIGTTILNNSSDPDVYIEGNISLARYLKAGERRGNGQASRAAGARGNEAPGQQPNARGNRGGASLRARQSGTVSSARAELVQAFGERGIAALERAGILTITTWADAPADLTGALQSGDRGAYWPAKGKGFIFADNLNPGEAVSVLLHEIGEHYGLEEMLGADAYARVVQQVKTLHKAGNPAIRAAWEHVARNYSDTPGGKRFMHEVIAKAGQDAKVLKMAWFQRLMDGIRAFLVKIGMKSVRSRADLQTLLRASLGRAMREAGKQAGPVAVNPAEYGMASRLSDQLAGMNKDADTGLFKGEAELDKPLTNAVAMKAWKSMLAKVGVDGLAGLIYNWNEGVLSEDGEKITGYSGRDREFTQKGQGGSFRVGKADFVRWLMSDAPFDTTAYGESILKDDEWRAEVEAARAASGLVDDAPMASRGTIGAAVDTLRSDATQNGAMNTLSSLFDSSETFNLWNRTVGTQFHKAKKDADFARVFKAVNNQIQDTSRYAIEAEQEAPNILQRLESVKDIGRALLQGSKTHQADMKAMSQAVFANIEGRQGVQQEVFTDAQLRDRFNLTDRQIELYREFRQAVDTSIDRLAQSTAMKAAQPFMEVGEFKNQSLDDTVEGIVGAFDAQLDQMRGLQETLTAKPTAAARREVVRSLTIDADGNLTQEYVRQPKAAEALLSASDEKLAKKLAAQIKVIEEAKAKIVELRAYSRELQAKGYAPAMRFGRFAVSVGDPATPDFFSMYETQAEANMAALALKREFPGADVTKSVINDEAWKMFAGVSPETVELFARFMGADESEGFKQYISLATSSRSAMKRMLERKGVAGFSWDASRVLAQFVTSNARQASINVHAGEMNEAVEAIPREKGDVQKEAQKLVDYVHNPKEEAATLRNLLFMHYMGGSLASAAVNLTQPVLMTAPYLSQFIGAGKLGKIMARSAKEAISGNTSDPGLRAAMQRANADGITQPHEIHQLMADAQGSVFGKSARGQAFAKAWGGFFALSEAYNRRLTFMAAYQVAREAGKRDAYGFAVNAVFETQGLYNKANRPNWARGAIGATLFTFKQFSISYLEFLARLPPKQLLIALAVLTIAAGLEGLPFAEDIEDVIDTAGQRLGYATNSKKALRKAIADLLGDGAAEFALHGFSALPGFPLDVSARLGMSNLIPGTRAFDPSKKDKGREILEVFGAAGGLAKGVMDASDSGRVSDAIPTAVRNAWKSYEMMSTGEYRDSKGRKVRDVDALDAAVKAIGFQPAGVAADSRRIGEQIRDVDIAKHVESEIAQEWARGILEKHPEDVKAARQRLADWNKDNPDMPIRIKDAQILKRVKEARLTRDQRFIKTVPPEMRRQVMMEITQ